MKVPFNDLNLQHKAIRDEIDNLFNSILESSAFIRGEYVEKFEEDFARASERNFCVSCANGTDALYIAMKALGIMDGDEVIAPAHSWISTTSTISSYVLAICYSLPLFGLLRAFLVSLFTQVK